MSRSPLDYNLKTSSLKFPVTDTAENYKQWTKSIRNVATLTHPDIDFDHPIHTDQQLERMDEGEKAIAMSYNRASRMMYAWLMLVLNETKTISTDIPERLENDFYSILTYLDKKYGKSTIALNNDVIHKYFRFKINREETAYQAGLRFEEIVASLKRVGVTVPESMNISFFLMQTVEIPTYEGETLRIIATSTGHETLTDVLEQFRKTSELRMDKKNDRTEQAALTAAEKRAKTCLSHKTGCHWCGNTGHCRVCCYTKKNGQPQSEKGKKVQEEHFRRKQQQSSQQQQSPQQQQPQQGRLAINENPDDLALDSGAYPTQIPNNNKDLKP